MRTLGSDRVRSCHSGVDVGIVLVTVVEVAGARVGAHGQAHRHLDCARGSSRDVGKGKTPPSAMVTPWVIVGR
jgi:hypothetical protein